jgi:hypothetical protein
MRGILGLASEERITERHFFLSLSIEGMRRCGAADVPRYSEFLLSTGREL